jgi:uncharacterized protein YbaR (Trm112 family)
MLKHMDEDAIVESACSRLVDIGCHIDKRCTTKERGIDIIAHSLTNGHMFFVEAKGGTSSRKDSARFGIPYSQSQVFDRVAKGVFTCLELRAKYPIRESEHVILAIPNTKDFHKYLDPVMRQLKDAGIEVWFEAIFNERA